MKNKIIILLVASNILTICVYAFKQNEQNRRLKKLVLLATEYGYNCERLGYSYDAMTSGWPAFVRVFGEDE
jgi:hypothetical protein